MRTTLLSFVCGIAVVAFADDAETEYSVQAYNGGITVEDPSYAFNALVHADGWQVCGHPKGRASSRAAPPSADGTCPFTIAVPDGPVRDLTGEVTATAAPSGGVAVCYRVVPRQTGRVATISVQGVVRGKDFAGGRALFDGVAKPLPDINEQERNEFGGKMRALRIESRDGAKYLDFAFPSSQRLSVMHNGGTPYYTIRLMAAAGETVVSGKAYTVSFTLRANKRLINANTPWTTAAGRDFVPLRIKPDVVPGSILDLTDIVPREPCGAHGRLVVKGDHFEFADKPGERVKFVGMNLHSYACYHTMEEARLLVDRFVKHGYNAVRFHNYENDYMGLTMGAPDEATPVPERFEGLDNLVEVCRERGLYVTVDLHIGRAVTYKRLGIDKPGKTVRGEIKALYLTNKIAKENFKTFIRGFLTHVNSHTGRRYADEPTLALVSVVNESACSWRQFFGEKCDPCALEYDFMREMRALIRDELKSDVPLTSNNSSPVFCLQASRQYDYDYVDDHFYFDHPQWPEDKRYGKSGWLPIYTANRRYLAEDGEVPRGAICTRMWGKPFVITEFNWCVPSVYRSYAGLLVGALAALQDWDGVWRYLWSHDHTRALHPETSNIAKLESTGDPLALAAERALMCLFLRGDLQPLAPRASFFIPKGALDIHKPGHDRVWHDQFKFPDAAWFVRLGTAMDTAPSDSRHDFVYPAGVRTPPEEAAKLLRLDELKRGGGAIEIDRARNAFTVSTPRTCGGAVEKGAFTAGALEVDVGNEITAFWASAMDGQPLATSERILLTHLPRMYNTGDRFADRAGKYMLEIGTLPYLVSRAQATVRLKTTRAKQLKVYALDTDGTRRAEIPARVDDGCLTFVCDTARDPSNAIYLYEISMLTRE